MSSTPSSASSVAPSLNGTLRKKLSSVMKGSLLENPTKKTSDSSTSSLRLKTDDPSNEVAYGLQRVYKKVLQPLEEKTKFNQFLATKYDDMDFESKPIILVVGPYSVGKSTFIKYLIGSDYPDINIGTEPTTDRFIVVMKGPEKKVMQGHALVNHKGLSFRTLHKFGNAFLSKLQASMTPDSSLLEGVCFVDTPGILSGHHTADDRGYDYQAVMAWLAERADRILVLFDAHKLDISDEFSQILNIIKPHSEKMRLIFNKADTVAPKTLLRIYGSLMWGLGKSLRAPEASKIYVGSFWGHPYEVSEWADLFEEDRKQLFDDLRKLPQQSASRKIGELTKRIKMVKAYSLVVTELQEELPTFYGKEKKKTSLIKDLDQLYIKIQRQRDLPANDFPDVEELKKNLSILPWEFKKITEKDIKNIDRLFEVDIPSLVEILPEIGQMKNTNAAPVSSPGSVPPKRPPRPKGSMWKKSSSASSFTATTTGTEDLPMPDEKVWIVKDNDPSRYRQWESTFLSLQPIDGKVDGKIAKRPLEESGLDKDHLKKIWNMADLDQDGKLTLQEFAIANFLINSVQDSEGGSSQDLPDELPSDLLPPKPMGPNQTDSD